MTKAVSGWVPIETVGYIWQRFVPNWVWEIIPMDTISTKMRIFHGVQDLRNLHSRSTTTLPDSNITVFCRQSLRFVAKYSSAPFLHPVKHKRFVCENYSFRYWSLSFRCRFS